MISLPPTLLTTSQPPSQPHILTAAAYPSASVPREHVGLTFLGPHLLFFSFFKNGPHSPRFGDLMAQPLAQILALLAGPSPYMLDGEGLVYLHLRVRVTVWDAFQRGDISYAAFLDCLELKAGHTKDLKQRLYGYKPCAPGYIFVWRCAYTTTRRMLIGAFFFSSPALCSTF